MKTILTGIKPTGRFHIGNYFGAIKPGIELSKDLNNKCLFFLADYHALNTIKDPKLFKELCYDAAASWLACGLDTNKVLFYRQSDVEEVFKLNWIISNITPKGLMNRAHAYKASVEENIQNGEDQDANINMGLYNYPILMAADILLMNSNYVPVGLDQKQHIEIAREIARMFNSHYGKSLVVPEEIISKNLGTIVGLDGRKMSKSYGNVIPLFDTEENLRKCINRIVTDSTPVDAPKSTDCAIFKIFSLFATEEEIAEMESRFQTGIGWGDVKKATFEVVNRELSPMREKYNYYISHTDEIDKIFEKSAIEVRKIARETLNRVEKAIGR